MATRVTPKNSTPEVAGQVQSMISADTQATQNNEVQQGYVGNVTDPSLVRHVAGVPPADTRWDRVQAWVSGVVDTLHPGLECVDPGSTACCSYVKWCRCCDS